MPGGGQEADETLSEAVCREVLEELGVSVECKELLFIVEGVHGESFHRVDLIFSCKYIDEIPNSVFHCDTNQVGIAWLDISTLNLQPLYPSKLRRQIMNYYQGKPYKVYLGNPEKYQSRSNTAVSPISRTTIVGPSQSGRCGLGSLSLGREKRFSFSQPVRSSTLCNSLSFAYLSSSKMEYQQASQIP